VISHESRRFSGNHEDSKNFRRSASEVSCSSEIFRTTKHAKSAKEGHQAYRYGAPETKGLHRLQNFANDSGLQAAFLRAFRVFRSSNAPELLSVRSRNPSSSHFQIFWQWHPIDVLFHPEFSRGVIQDSEIAIEHIEFIPEILRMELLWTARPFLVVKEAPDSSGSTPNQCRVRTACSSWPASLPTAGAG